MSRLSVLLLLVVLYSGKADVASITPYVGTALHYQMIALSGGSQDYDSFDNLEPFISIASEYEAGITAPSYTLYAAYHHYPLNRTIIWGNGLRWCESRFLLGGRWHMNSICRSRVQPTIGLALSHGRAHITGNYFSFEMRHDRTYSKWSEFSFGGMLEMGLLIHTGTPLDIDLLSRMEAYDASFIGNADNSYSVRYHAMSPSLHMGARYVFPKIKIGK